MCGNTIIPQRNTPDGRTLVDTLEQNHRSVAHFRPNASDGKGVTMSRRTFLLRQPFTIDFDSFHQNSTLLDLGTNQRLGDIIRE